MLMKYFKSILLFFSFSFIAKAQAPIIEWQKSFGGSNSEISKSIVQTPDGGYITAGYSKSGNISQSCNRYCSHQSSSHRKYSGYF